MYAKVCDKLHPAACSVVEITLAVNPKPSLPSFTLTQPSRCGGTTGSINFCQTVAGMDYKLGETMLHGNGSAQVFTGLAPGSNPSFTVEDVSTGCVSASFTCSDAVAECPSSSPTQNVARAVTTATIGGTEMEVKAFPNPFNDRINFVVHVPNAGSGSLVIYNTLGQKVKEVYQGHINAGSQSFEMNLPAKQRSMLVYVFSMDGKQVTGKLIQSAN